ncbi:MAG: hypothetical protein RR229_05935 [Oscillospiraceae bacterium]
MKLWEFSGKQVKITCITGEVFVGIAYDYTPPQDNEPEIASISVGDYEIYENEIKSIELTA